MTSSPNHVLYILCPSAASFLISLVASFVVLDVLESSLNWFFHSDLYSRKKGNEVTRVIFFGPGGSKGACVKDDLLFTSSQGWFYVWFIPLRSGQSSRPTEWPVFRDLTVIHEWIADFVIMLHLSKNLSCSQRYWFQQRTHTIALIIYDYYLTIRLWARDFYELINDEAEGRINYRLIEIQSE